MDVTMSENHTDVPAFWAVWASPLDTAEIFASPDDAVRRAHDIARLHIGEKVHLMEFISVGTVEISNDQVLLSSGIAQERGAARVGSR
jgi:hypothetical protein